MRGPAVPPVTPLDVVKTRLQAQSAAVAAVAAAPRLQLSAAVDACCGEFIFCHNAYPACLPHPSTGAAAAAAAATAAPPTAPLRGTVDGLFKIARQEGVSALWRGLPPSLVLAVPATTLYFVAYELGREELNRRSGGRLADYSPLVAGAAARSLVASIVSPLELMKTRLQSGAHKGRGQYRHVLEGVRTMVQASGALSLWRGLGPTLWRDVPFSGAARDSAPAGPYLGHARLTMRRTVPRRERPAALYWFGYEQLKQLFAARLRWPRAGYVRDFTLSFYAGALAGAVRCAPARGRPPRRRGTHGPGLPLREVGAPGADGGVCDDAVRRGQDARADRRRQARPPDRRGGAAHPRGGRLDGPVPGRRAARGPHGAVVRHHDRLVRGGQDVLYAPAGAARAVTPS